MTGSLMKVRSGAALFDAKNSQIVAPAIRIASGQRIAGLRNVAIPVARVAPSKTANSAWVRGFTGSLTSKMRSFAVVILDVLTRTFAPAP